VIFDSHEAGGWKAVYVSATAGNRWERRPQKNGLNKRFL